MACTQILLFISYTFVCEWIAHSPLPPTHPTLIFPEPSTSSGVATCISPPPLCHCAHHKSHFSASVSSVHWPFSSLFSSRLVSLRLIAAKFTLIKYLLETHSDWLAHPVVSHDHARFFNKWENCCQFNGASVKHFRNTQAPKSPTVKIPISHSYTRKAFHSAK